MPKEGPETDGSKAAAEIEAAKQRFNADRISAAQRLDVALRTNDNEIEILKDALSKKQAILDEDRMVMVAAAELSGQDTFAIEMQYADASRELARSNAEQITEIERVEAEKRASDKAAIEQMALSRAWRWLRL